MRLPRHHKRGVACPSDDNDAAKSTTCLLNGTILTHVYYISRYEGYNAYITLYIFFLAISAFLSFNLQIPISTAEDLPRTIAGWHRGPLRQLHVRPTPLLLASKLLESMDSGQALNRPFLYTVSTARALSSVVSTLRSRKPRGWRGSQEVRTAR